MIDSELIAANILMNCLRFLFGLQRYKLLHYEPTLFAIFSKLNSKKMLLKMTILKRTFRLFYLRTAKITANELLSNFFEKNKIKNTFKNAGCSTVLDFTVTYFYTSCSILFQNNRKPVNGGGLRITDVD
jgi:hypothetical protein